MKGLFARLREIGSAPVRPPEPLPPLWFDDEAELVLAPPAPALEGDEDEWWESEYGSWRFSAEAGAMRRFPGFRPSVGTDRLLQWTGWLESALPPGRHYLVSVKYPSCFPDEAPLVTILQPELPVEVPHLLSGQRPCLYRGGYRDGYDPCRTTAATLVAWTALWIHAFETWQWSGQWPGAEA